MTPLRHRRPRSGINGGSPPSAVTLWLFAVLILTAGCSATAAASPAGPSPVPGLPSDAAVTCPEVTLAVTTADELSSALHDAAPGTVIGMADGSYDGEFDATTSGTAVRPIWLCGGKAAVLRGRGTSRGGAVLHLDRVDNWRLLGFTVRDGQKGVMADGLNGSLLQDLTVTEIGDEGVHLRSGSSGNLLRGLDVSHTGLREQRFGEGIYIGSAVGNWCLISGCGPDRSDRNVIVDNVISGTTAESVDIKEGTTGGILQDNTFDGAAMSGGADSWVDVKGNGWTVRGNRGESSGGSGFQVHQLAKGWGTGNLFENNVADVRGAGYGFELRPIADNIVRCSNQVVAAAKGFSNAKCD